MKRAVLVLGVAEATFLVVSILYRELCQSPWLSPMSFVEVVSAVVVRSKV